MTSSETLLPAVELDILGRVLFENIGAFDPAFRQSIVRNVYAARHVKIAPVLLARLPDDCVMHAGGHFIVSCAGSLVAEQVPRYQFDPTSLDQGNEASCADEVLIVARYGIYTWGHWLGELLPRMVLAEAAYPARFRYVLPRSVLTDTNPDRPWMRIRESIEAYGIDASRIFVIDSNRSYRFPNAFLIPGVWSDRMIHPSATDMMRRNIRPGPRSARPEKLYVRRVQSYGRRLENGSEIERIAIGNGYLAATTGTLHFASQVSMFSRAKQVAGVLGSDLTNLIYAPEGVRVVTMAPPNFGDWFFYALILDRKGWMVDLRGPATGQAEKIHHKRAFSIDPDAFGAALARFSGVAVH